MLFSRQPFIAALALALGLSACSKDNGVVLFSVQDDIALGQQVAAKTDSTYRAKGQLLDRSNPANARAYLLLDSVVNRVLNCGKLDHRNDFTWDVKIIKDTATLNAFATPGGHIYVYSALVRYLQNASQLAGVLGHEITHADHRHTSQQLQKQYGLSLLLGVLTGNNPGQLAQLATGLTELKFSRDYETEADQYSVIFLNATNYYACDGAAGFFIKLQQQGQTGSTPAFLSDHPDPGNRVQAIQAKAAELNCANRSVSNASFLELQRLLK